MIARGIVLQTVGDPGREELLSEALALLEAQPPGPELVSAHAELAGSRLVVASYPEAIAAADKALALAVELGLPEPPRALGARGAARAALGDREGIEDMLRALALAIDRGEGRAAAVLHNNLAMVSWQYDGPPAALSACREGLAFCERRGIAEMATMIAAASTLFASECGRTEEAVAEAGPLADRLEGDGNINFIEPRAVQLRLLSERGISTDTLSADELVEAARPTGEPQLWAMAIAAGARLLSDQGRLSEAKALLVELAEPTEIRLDPYYVTALPELVRTALALGEPELAARLLEGVEGRTPLAEHALYRLPRAARRSRRRLQRGRECLCRGGRALAGVRNVPERAYALLGQGRCLAALGQPEAQEPLGEARELFASMGYRPALADTETLLEQTTAAAS